MKTKQTPKLKHVIIRATQAGVFAGHLKSRKGDEVTLTNCRRLWSWSGGASLSQLAKEGSSRPQDCRFTVTLDEITVLGVIEIIPTTKAAQDNINSVKEWRA